MPETQAADLITDGEGWLTVQEVRGLWPEGETAEDDILQLLVDSAEEQCMQYAPELADGALIPKRWRLAQLMQVQALWQSAKSGPGDSIGPDGFTITVFPMDRTVKNLIRPKRAVGAVG